jgi:glycosyltransferase involved in cell wall biosynthesis
MKVDKHPSVSIVIPSYNSYKTIPITLEEIFKQSAADSLIEIIIVDSSDDLYTKTYLESIQSDKIRITVSGIKVMPAVQRNIGAKIALGEILVFIDSDAFPSKDWLQEILNAYHRGWKAGGGSYLLPHFQYDNAIAKAQYFLEFSEFIPVGKERRKILVPSCNLFCEKNLFLQVNGFPEIRASEDSLFGSKLSKVTPMIFIPKSKVYHIFRENKNHFLENQIMLGKYIFIFHRLHYNYFYYKWFFPILLLPIFLFFKTFRIFFRAWRMGRIHSYGFVTTFPLFLQGLRAWSNGFLMGIKEYRTIVNQLNMNDFTGKLK